MGIISYTPPKKIITDLRSVNGDFYTALCDVCGTEFYPKRRSAKYCNPNCKVIQFRINLANGNILANGNNFKKTQKTGKLPKKNQIADIRGVYNIYEYLKDEYVTHGRKQEILEALRSLEERDLDDDEFDYFEYGKHIVSRLTFQNYRIERK